MFLIGHGGRLMNHVRRAWRAPVFDVGEESEDHPIRGAYDNRAGVPAYFAEAVDGGSIVIDKDVLVNGDFEAEEEFDGWDVDGTTIAQDFDAVPGELWSVRLHTNFGEGTHFGYLRNLYSGRWLSPSGAWVSTETAFASGDEFDLTRVFRVEPYGACQSPEVRLRLTVQGDDGGFEEIAAWPHTDAVSIHGMSDLLGGLALEVADAGASGYSRRLQRDGRRVLWAYLGECKSYREIRITWLGQALSPPGFGEIVLTQTTRIARENAPGGVAPRPDLEIAAAFANDRAAAPSGALHVAAQAGNVASREAAMSFFLTSAAELGRLRDEVFAASGGGVYPTILIGPSAIGDVCMFGYFGDRLPQQFPGGSDRVLCKVELTFSEDPFPIFFEATPVFVEVVPV